MYVSVCDLPLPHCRAAYQHRPQRAVSLEGDGNFSKFSELRAAAGVVDLVVEYALVLQHLLLAAALAVAHGQVPGAREVTVERRVCVGVCGGVRERERSAQHSRKRRLRNADFGGAKQTQFVHANAYNAEQKREGRKEETNKAFSYRTVLTSQTFKGSLRWRGEIASPTDMN